MSNEPMYKGPLVPPSASQQRAEPGARESNANVATLLAALERLEAAVRDRSNTIDLFRHDLGEMAALLKQAWASLDGDGRLGDAAAVLHGLEARIQRMMVFAGPADDAAVKAALAAAAPVAAAAAAAASLQAAEEPPPTADEVAFIEAMGDEPATDESAGNEPDRVPTVSDVVAQLRGADDSGGAGDAKDRALFGGPVTTVAMLEAMVEELAASMPIARRDAEPPQAVEPAPEAVQPNQNFTVLGDVVAIEVAPADTTPAASTAEPELPEAILIMPPPDERPAAESPVLEWNLDAAAPAASREAVMPDVELLNRFARWETMPYLDQEVGTAVIFEATPETPVAQSPPDATAASPAADAGSGDVDLDALLFEPSPEPEPDPAAFLLEPVPQSEPTTPQPSEPPKNPEPEPQPAASFSAVWEIDPPAPAAVAAAAAMATAAATANETATTAPVPQEPPPSDTAGDLTWAFEPPAPAEPAMPQRTPSERARDPRDNDMRDNDPLAPLKAMSDEELIALFE